MDVVLAILKKTTTKIKPPMDEVWFGLANLAVKDACPNVVKQGAQLVIDLSLLQSTAVRYRGEHTIIHAVLPLLTHKHTAIRVLGIKVTADPIEEEKMTRALMFFFHLGRLCIKSYYALRKA
jgi:hypothetical protein